MPETLADRAILVAEDEYFLASDLKRELRRLGATVVGPVASVEGAMDLIESVSHIDGAILDINLGGGMAFPVADVLRERAVPFVFATGYDQTTIPARFSDVVRCEKPIGSDKLSEALGRALTQPRSG